MERLLISLPPMSCQQAEHLRLAGGPVTNTPASEMPQPPLRCREPVWKPRNILRVQGKEAYAEVGRLVLKWDDPGQCAHLEDTHSPVYTKAAARGRLPAGEQEEHTACALPCSDVTRDKQYGGRSPWRLTGSAPCRARQRPAGSACPAPPGGRPTTHKLPLRFRALFS